MAVRTYEFLNALGMARQELNQQADVTEFQLHLIDSLEAHMKGTEHEGFYANLFTIHVENVTKCTKVDY